jgi:hypothetical protein
MSEQFYMYTYSQVISDYARKRISAANAVLLAVQIKRKPGQRLKVNVTKLTEELGMHRTTFYKALSELRTENELFWDAEHLELWTKEERCSAAATVSPDKCSEQATVVSPSGYSSVASGLHQCSEQATDTPLKLLSGGASSDPSYIDHINTDKEHIFNSPGVDETFQKQSGNVSKSKKPKKDKEEDEFEAYRILYNSLRLENWAEMQKVTAERKVCIRNLIKEYGDEAFQVFENGLRQLITEPFWRPEGGIKFKATSPIRTDTIISHHEKWVTSQRPKLTIVQQPTFKIQDQDPNGPALTPEQLAKRSFRNEHAV